MPTVAVFGDVFAASIARGLSDSEPGDAAWTVDNLTRDDAALTGPESATQLADAWVSKAGPIDAAIVMLGRNDTGPLRDPDGALVEAGSPTWDALYAERVQQVAAAFRERHIPIIWVGLPIVREPAEAQRYAALNEIVRDAVAKGGATFVDAWQLFTDDNGDFAMAGPDVNGRAAVLRWTNGWNFTRAGALKLASAVAPDLKRIRDRLKASAALATVANANPAAFDQALSIDINAQIRREAGLPPAPGPEPAKPAGPVLALTAAPLAANGALLPIPQPRPLPPVAAAAVPHPGRADNFAWPRP